MAPWSAVRRTRSATSAVQPVWWQASTPRPVSPWKYSWKGSRLCQSGGSGRGLASPKTGRRPCSSSRKIETRRRARSSARTGQIAGGYRATGPAARPECPPANGRSATGSVDRTDRSIRTLLFARGQTRGVRTQSVMFCPGGQSTADFRGLAAGHGLPELQFELQFPAVQEGSRGTNQGRGSRLNGSGRPRPELLMRLGFAPFRGSNPRASAAHGPLPRTPGRGLSRVLGPMVLTLDLAAPHVGEAPMRKMAAEQEQPKPWHR